MHPDWLKTRLPSGENFNEIKGILHKEKLHTVCEEALCPNIGECFEQRTATFLILGDICTRRCGFCAVKKGNPSGIYEDEPYRIAGAVKEIGLQYVVITSVTRDDLTDGGASIYSRTLHAIRRAVKNCRIEVLIPDFRGNTEALEILLEAKPDVLNHNLETIPRLYSLVRPQADYFRSLKLLRHAHEKMPALIIKSGMMLGIGEEWNEILDTMLMIRSTGCGILTLGQYLKPTKNALPIQRYYTPDEFELLRAEGKRMGFQHVESGPLVRSSYHAKTQSDILFLQEGETIRCYE
ncbi:MAG: lipoyl synthase [Candidatus Loosdrechtia sp.]|uniref:lipoyl synthase n=1 Tax=Candidatus Loosdrechtia sp. TaxID=3101272 RepID=UPI003A6696CF|nr:MAG: lipoyl synthase [Candidatus Jettenia sp. AMX2]